MPILAGDVLAEAAMFSWNANIVSESTVRYFLCAKPVAQETYPINLCQVVVNEIAAPVLGSPCPLPSAQ